MLLVGSAPLWAAAAALESWPEPSAAGWRAFAYLTVVSSLAGFWAYLSALRRLPAPVFLSHAWVIPLVAAGLGVGVLGESLPARAYAAGLLIVLGLAATAVGHPNTTPARPASKHPPRRWVRDFLTHLRVALSAIHV